MDIEDYLRQKKELEAKKQLLEAKEKLKEVREPPREKPKFRPVAPSQSHPQAAPVTHAVREAREYRAEMQDENESTIKPWMIWDFLMLLIVVTLFSVAYFFPRVDMDTMKADVMQEVLKASATGKAVAEPKNTAETDTKDTVVKNTAPSDKESGLEVEHVSTPKKPGPRVLLQLKDPDAGFFDEKGKIGSKILDITGDDYYDFSLILTNKEDFPTVCKLDKEIDVYGNFDTVVTGKDVKPNYQIEELDGKEVYEKHETAPGSTEVGTYAGKGSLVGRYDARCYFCLDKECESYDQDAESKTSALFKVILRGKSEVNLTA